MNKREEYPPSKGEPRLIAVGGFLGAGKTTSIIRLAFLLRKSGQGVGVVTSASGGESVDNIRLRAVGLPTEQARQSAAAMIQAAEGLRGKGADSVFLELPGGSCPGALELGSFALAPLSVLVDATRALKMLGLESGNAFSEPVTYLYRKQIEQASLLVVNRADVIGPGKLAALRQALEREANGATILELTKAGSGLEEWLNCLERIQNRRTTAEADAAIVTRAERSLAALNCVVNLSTVKYFDGDKVLLNVAAVTQHILRQESVEIAHLKMVLQSSDGVEGYASVSTAGSDITPELTGSLAEPIQVGKMVLNLRAEVDPGLLNSAVNRALLAVVEKWPELFARMEYCEHFRPESQVVEV